MGAQAKIRARRKRREALRRVAEIDDLTGTGYRWPKETHHAEGNRSSTDPRSTPGPGPR